MTETQTVKPARHKIKRKVGRPRTDHRFIGLRCLPDFLERIDKWRKRNALDRSKAIKALVEIGLKREAK